MRFKFKIELQDFDPSSLQELYSLCPDALTGSVGDRWWIEFDRSGLDLHSVIHQAIADVESLGVSCIRVYHMDETLVEDLVGHETPESSWIEGL